MALAPGLHLGGSYPVGLMFPGFALFVGIGALSRQDERPYSASIFYLALGAAASIGLGVLGIARLDPITNGVLLARVTEVALAIAVFGAGIAVEQHVARSSKLVIAVLLLIVMPVRIRSTATPAAVRARLSGSR